MVMKYPPEIEPVKRKEINSLWKIAHLDNGSDQPVKVRNTRIICSNHKFNCIFIKIKLTSYFLWIHVIKQGRNSRNSSSRKKKRRQKGLLIEFQFLAKWHRKSVAIKILFLCVWVYVFCAGMNVWERWNLFLKVLLSKMKVPDFVLLVFLHVFVCC